MEILPDWYQTWFDSPFYHILYKHRDEEEAKVFLDNLLDFLKPAPGGTFLDMACGKGRHSLYLNTRGYDVTGIDLSARSIEYASSFENEHLSFFVHDMRNLFRTNYFDFVLNLFTSFGYFDKERDNVSVIDSAAKSLKKGGFMVLDYMNCNKAAQNLREEEAREIEGIVFRIKRSVEKGFIVKRITFEHQGKKYNFSERVEIFDLEGFRRMFRLGGLKIEKVWGDYDLNEFDTSVSDRLIILAKK